MSKCPICGKEFNPHITSKKPRKYCSHECYRIANTKHVNERKKVKKEAARLEWAKHEAEIIMHNMIGLEVDNLADYIYNNYRERKKTK